MVTGRNKRAARGPLRPRLRARGGARGQGRRRRGSPRSGVQRDLATVHYVRQGDPQGLGHAVLCAAAARRRRAVRGPARRRPHRPARPAAHAMIEVRAQRGGSVHRADGGPARADPPLRLRRRRADATRTRRRPGHRPGREAGGRRGAEQPTPSSAATCSTRRSSTSCARPQPGRGGEIQLTDALAALAAEPRAGGGVHGVVFRGRRYDTGDRLDYLKAVVRLACERDDLGPPTSATWLSELRRRGGSPVKSVDAAPRRTASTRHRAAVADRRCSCSTRRAACWPRTSSARVALPAVRQLARWTATPSGSRTSRGASEETRWCCRSSATSRPGAGRRPRWPGAGRPDHDRRADARRAPTPSSRSSGPTAAWRRVAASRPRAAPASMRPAPGERRRAPATSVLQAGTVLGPPQLALLAAVGRDRVRSRPRPRVVVHVHRQRAGRARQPLGRGQICDSNSFMLTAAAREAGAMAYRVGIVAGRRRDAAARRDRGPAGPRRPRRHHAAASASARTTWSRRCSRAGSARCRLRQGRHAARQAAGLRHDRPGPHPALRPARQPGRVVRLLRGVRPAGDPHACWALEPLLPPHESGRSCAARRSTSPPGKRQFPCGVLGRSTTGGYVVTPGRRAGSHLVGGLAHADA